MRRIRLVGALLLAFLGIHCAPQAPTPIDKNPTQAGGSTLTTQAAKGDPSVPGPLKARLEAALEHIRNRKMLSSFGFWTIFHGILGLGPKDTQLLDEKTDQMVNAIEYIRTGGELKGMRFIPTGDGLDVQIGPQFEGQGHQDQFVAEMVQWGLPLDTKFKVLGKDYTFQDFVNHSKMRASTQQKNPMGFGQELSWAVLVVAECFGPDHSYVNTFKEKIDVADMVRYELDLPMDTAACGGTHRLFGLTWAYYLHRQRGGKKEGVWKDCADALENYKELAKKYQNSDGSFSTEYFKGPGNKQDVGTQISTTGHILEWLALAMTDKELQQPWVQDAASALSLMILRSKEVGIEGGSLYHATHGLLMYYARVYGNLKDAGPLPPPPRD